MASHSLTRAYSLRTYDLLTLHNAGLSGSHGRDGAVAKSFKKRDISNDLPVPSSTTDNDVILRGVWAHAMIILLDESALCI